MTKNSLTIILKKTMKKTLPILLTIPALLFTGCKSNKIDTSKIALDYGHIRDANYVSWTEFESLDYDNLDALMTNKESFVLLTYDNITCGCWRDFAPIAVMFANEYHYDFRVLDVNELSGHKNKFDIYTGQNMLPGIVFIRRGKVIRQTIYGKVDENKRQMFKEYVYTRDPSLGFKPFMLKNVYLPKMYYIDKDKLDEKLDANEELNLYVAKKNCQDCGYVNTHYLRTWNDKVHEIENPLYIFDIEKYQSSEYPSDYYQTIKNTYGLSVAGNATFGYDTPLYQGLVPTFQRRIGWTVTDMITTLNEYIEKVNDEYVIHSYFTEARVNASPMMSPNASKYVIEGKIASKDDVREITYESVTYYLFNRDAQYNLHLEATKLYVSTYLK